MDVSFARKINRMHNEGLNEGRKIIRAERGRKGEKDSKDRKSFPRRFASLMIEGPEVN